MWQARPAGTHPQLPPVACRYLGQLLVFATPNQVRCTPVSAGAWAAGVAAAVAGGWDRSTGLGASVLTLALARPWLQLVGQLLAAAANQLW